RATPNFCASIAFCDHSIIRLMLALPESDHSRQILAAIRSAALSLRSRLRSRNSLSSRAFWLVAAGVAAGASASDAETKPPERRRTAKNTKTFRMAGIYPRPAERQTEFSMRAGKPAAAIGAKARALASKLNPGAP